MKRFFLTLLLLLQTPFGAPSPAPAPSPTQTPFGPAAPNPPNPKPPATTIATPFGSVTVVSAPIQVGNHWISLVPPYEAWISQDLYNVKYQEILAQDGNDSIYAMLQTNAFIKQDALVRMGAAFDQLCNNNRNKCDTVLFQNQLRHAP